MSSELKTNVLCKNIRPLRGRIFIDHAISINMRLQRSRTNKANDIELR